jgi:hypothetical protein
LGVLGVHGSTTGISGSVFSGRSGFAMCWGEKRLDAGPESRHVIRIHVARRV